MKSMSRRNFVTLMGAAAGTIAAGSALSGCGNSGSNSNSSTSNKSVDTDVKNMSWDDVLKEAKGQTVTFLAWGSGGADSFVQQFWNDLKTKVKSEYDITLEPVEYSEAEYQKITTDITNGASATYDMFWYTGAMIAPIRAVDGVFDNEWITKLPNYKYLDTANDNVTFDGADKVDGKESPFQTLNPSLVYSTDSWDHSLAWNATSGSKKGLPHNFTELASWVKENPGKFSYMDLTGKGSFHGLFFLKAILAELTDDGKGGWKAVYDESDSASARRKKIQENIEKWYEWSASSEASESAFYEKASYLWAYLNEIKTNLMQNNGAPMYMATAPDMMNYVKSGDLACTFTTCTSVSARVASAPDSYMANPAIYMLQTSVGAWDYSVIMQNSKNKAASMVIANAMLDPDMQSSAFKTTGNGYNVSYDKLDSSQKEAFDAVFKEMGTLSPTATEIEQQSYTDKFGKVAKWISSGWDQKVNKA